MRDKAILQAILNTAPDAIIRIDHKGVILGFLGAAESMFQYSENEIVGERVERLMPDLHADQHLDYIEAHLANNAGELPHRGRRLQAVRRNGTAFPVEIALSEIDDEGQVQFVGTVRDLTRRVADEKRIGEMQARLEHASRNSALAELSAQMAHELNQPLTAVANYMDALELKLARLQVVEVNDLISLASRAGNQARLAGGIVSRLRQTLVHPDVDVEPGDFHDAVAQVMTALIASIGAEDIDISIEHLGEAREVSFDQVQLHQVLANLVSNALKALE
jgi:two-component system sensor kinase FixL